MYVVSDLDLHCLHICLRKRLICAQIQMIGPVTNLFHGHLPTATVLGNYSLHPVKILLVCRLLIHLTRV